MATSTVAPSAKTSMLADLERSALFAREGDQLTAPIKRTAALLAGHQACLGELLHVEGHGRLGQSDSAVQRTR